MCYLRSCQELAQVASLVKANVIPDIPRVYDWKELEEHTPAVDKHAFAPGFVPFYQCDTFILALMNQR